MEDLYEVKKCNTLDVLFRLCNGKEVHEVQYQVDNEYHNIRIDHGNNVFIPDGIVNQDVWNSGTKKKILFVLKEAYGDDWGNYTLATWLREHPQRRIWRRVAKWTYGIENTSREKIVRYISNLSHDQYAECLDQIAVLNLKKSDGKKSSVSEEIDKYAEYDREEIKQEIKLINPDIVICGSTYKTLVCTVYQKPELYEQRVRCDNWYSFIV